MMVHVVSFYCVLSLEDDKRERNRIHYTRSPSHQKNSMKKIQNIQIDLSHIDKKMVKVL